MKNPPVISNFDEVDEIPYKEIKNNFSVLIGALYEIDYFLKNLEEHIDEWLQEELLEYSFPELETYIQQSNQFIETLKFKFPHIIRDFYEKEI